MFMLFLKHSWCIIGSVLHDFYSDSIYSDLKIMLNIYTADIYLKNRSDTLKMAGWGDCIPTVSSLLTSNEWLQHKSHRYESWNLLLFICRVLCRNEPATTSLSSQSRRSQSADVLTVDSCGSYFVETGWHNAIWKEVGIIKVTTVSAALEFWKTWMDISDAGLKIAEVRCNYFLLACLKKALYTPDVKIFLDRNAVSPQIFYCLHADYLKTSRDNDFKQNVITPEKAQLKWFLHLQRGSLRSSNTCWLGLRDSSVFARMNPVAFIQIQLQPKLILLKAQWPPSIGWVR